jgi:hypothetical protein
VHEDRESGAVRQEVSETLRMAERSVMQRADEVLRWFFAEQAASATPRRSDRLRRAEADIRGCLEELVPLLFTEQERALLALERQFEPDDAPARVASADAILLVLPVYLDEPRWHGTDLEDRRLRIQLASTLVEQMLRASADWGVDLGRAATVVEAQVRHEIWMLRQEREAARRW